MGIKVRWSPRVIGDSQRIYRSEQPFNRFNLPSVLDTFGAEVSFYDDPVVSSGVSYYYAIETIYGTRTKLSRVVSLIAGPTEGPAPAGVPVVESYQSTGSTSPNTALIATKPTGVEVGDLLVIVCGNDYAVNGPEFPLELSGWNYVGQYGNLTYDCHVAVYWRIADGTEGATQTINSANWNDWYTHYIRISGAHPTDPVVANAFGGGASSVHTMPVITTPVDHCLLIIGGSFDGTDGIPFSTSSPEYSITDEVSGQQFGGGVDSFWGQKDQPVAGLTTSAIVQSANTDGMSKFQIAIAPISG